MHTRPIRWIVLSSSLLVAAAVVAAGCAQGLRGAPASVATPDVSAGYEQQDIIVITGQQHDALSRAQANAIASFNREALAAIAVETAAQRATTPRTPTE